MSLRPGEIIDRQADVIIIGGGGAGLRAAIAAREKGADVLLVSKSPPGYANNTAIAGGAFAAAGGWREPRDNPDVYQGDTLRSGCFINNVRLVQTVARGSIQQVSDLERFGVNLARMEGALRVSQVPGHTYPRNIGCVEHIGTGFSVPLRRYALKLGAQFLEGVIITRLIKKDSTVVGAVGVDEHGQLHSLKAKAIILATGGLGQIYRQTNNALESTGDGYALAYEAGLPLQDMEFVQFYPTCVQRRAVMALAAYEYLVFMGGAAIRNTAGQDILELYGLRSPQAMTRDHLAQAMMREIKAGRSHDGFLTLDLTTIPEARRERFRSALPRGMPPETDALLVSPAVHYAMGGVQINERAETALKGLYAAGEVCGGVHGANRLAGNALTDIFVFGDIAGGSAAARASAIPMPELDGGGVKEEINRLRELLSKTGQERVTDLLASLKKTMWDNVGVIRDENGLKRAISEIAALREALDRVGGGGPRESLQAIRLDKMLTVAEMVTRSALMRRESRGAHYRSDCPDQKDPEWRCNAVVSKAGEKMALSVHPVSTPPSPR
ncbi:MAG: FAD-binding protein [Chloroflexi bacterium]|nr:FAD-binding protein [Chloroflexota bacterium]